MNVELLRAVQRSIEDRTRAFDMTSWSTCIGAHTCMVLHGIGKLDAIPIRAGEYLGLSPSQADTLFLGYYFRDRYSRSIAIARIESLINKHEATQHLVAVQQPVALEQPALVGI